MRFADQVALTNMAGDMSPDLYRELSAHFSDADICELGTVMAVIAGMAKLSFILHVVEREPYCPFGAQAA
jgi:undecaprenyl pyrophosphate phosphatase UppP